MSDLVPAAPATSVAERAFRTLTAVALAAGLLFLLDRVSFLLPPVAAGFLMFYLLSPLVSLLEDRGMARGPAAALCFGVLLAVIAGLVVAMTPWLVSWLRQIPAEGERSVFEIQLSQRFAEWEQRGRVAYPGVDWGALTVRANAVLETERRRLMELLPLMATGLLSRMGLYVLAPVVGAMLLLAGAAMHRTVMGFVPNAWFETVLLLLHRVDRKIAGYLRGLAAQAAILSVVMTLALLAVGMPASPVFGCVFAVLNVIPIVGPVLGAGAGLLYAVIEPSAPTVLVLLVCYGIVHALDVALLQPAVFGRSLELHPATVVAGLSIGGTLGGVVGMLVSIPAIAIAKAVVITLVEARRQGALR